jgi:hypothetical protein
MQNPFASPRTQGQWLIGSLCWTFSCLILSLLAYTLSVCVLNLNENVQDWAYMLLGCCCFWPAHLLIWKRAVDGCIRWLEPVPANALAFRLICGAWVVLLIVFQIIALLMGVVLTTLLINFLTSLLDTTFLKPFA